MAPPPTGAADPANEQAIAKQLQGIRSNARRQLQSGDRQAALVTAESGLAIRPTDTVLVQLIRDLNSDARKRAMGERAKADTYGALATGQQSFRDAEARFSEADRQTAQQRPAEAVRSFWLAEELFIRAATDGKAAADKAAEDKAAADAAKAASAAAAAKPPPTAAPPPPPQVNPDETAVVAALQRYAQAFSNNDAAGVSAAMPSMEVRATQKSFGQLDSQKMTITNPRVTIEAGGARATAVAHVVHQVQPKAGAAQTPLNRAVTFDLEKQNGAWIILRRR